MCVCVCLLLPLIDRIEKRFLSLVKLLTLEDEDERKRERHVNAYEKKRRKKKGSKKKWNRKKKRYRTSPRNIYIRCAVHNQIRHL